MDEKNGRIKTSYFIF